MRTFRAWAAILLILVCGNGCGKPNSSKATLDYWNIMTAPSKDRCGLLEEIALMPDPGPAMTGEVLRQYATHGAKQRAEMASAPLLGVDPIAVDYGALRLKTIGEALDLLNYVSSFGDQYATATSGSEVGGMFLLALMAHANDQEDVLLNAFRQGITETTAVAQDLRNRAKAIAEKKSAMERSVMQMQQSEMEARAKLTRKYNVEFTSSELPKLTATALAAANQIDGATLQKHLLGQSVKLNTGSWTFEAGEFETFRVLTAEEMGHTQRYVVAAQVRGNLSGRTHDLVINMLYHREKAGLVLCAVSAQGK